MNYKLYFSIFTKYFFLQHKLHTLIKLCQYSFFIVISLRKIDNNDRFFSTLSIAITYNCNLLKAFNNVAKFPRVSVSSCKPDN